MKPLRDSFAFLILIGAGLLIATLSFATADSTLLTAPSESRGAATAPPDGGSIYKQKCSMCHGADGKGFPALKTPDFTDSKWQKTAKDKEIETVIKNGKKGTAMPAFADKLKEDEVRALVGYLRSLDSSKKK